MQLLQEHSYIQIEVKKSTFIAHIIDIKEFNSLHVKLKDEHPKANHIVWATRYLNEYNQVVENCSDDGEPKGTSGPPVLNVMRGSELIECGILIVRYFGGIKLGTGGLVRAYGGAAKEVIADAKLCKYVKKEVVSFSTEYPLVQRFEHYLEKATLQAVSKEYGALGVEWKISLSENEKSEFLEFATGYERDGFNLVEG